jgi:hypothetical protein
MSTGFVRLGGYGDEMFSVGVYSQRVSDGMVRIFDTSDDAMKYAYAMSLVHDLPVTVATSLRDDWEKFRKQLGRISYDRDWICCLLSTR